MVDDKKAQPAIPKPELVLPSSRFHLRAKKCPAPRAGPEFGLNIGGPAGNFNLTHSRSTLRAHPLQAMGQIRQELFLARDDFTQVEDARLDLGIIYLRHEAFIAGCHQQ